jgi:hypothetical protein
MSYKKQENDNRHPSSMVYQLTDQDLLQLYALFRDANMEELPADWRERVLVGSDRKQSGTARENLSGLQDVIPDVLPDVQKQMVDYAAPGLRRLLGYSN